MLHAQIVNDLHCRWRQRFHCLQNLGHTAMVNYTTLNTTLGANSTQVTALYNGLSPLDCTCLAWLIVISGVILSELCRRTRECSKGSFYAWITWLPFLVGILPSVFAIVSIGLEPRHNESYTQSQATRDFIGLCSSPLTQGYNSSTALHTFLKECNAVQNRMNADIGGVGIRISLYISLVVAILSSLVGHFHQEKTAVKDIGTAQLACEFFRSLDLVCANIFT
jgi:uncharacterized membrane protein YeiB